MHWGKPFRERVSGDYIGVVEYGVTPNCEDDTGIDEMTAWIVRETATPSENLTAEEADNNVIAMAERLLVRGWTKPPIAAAAGNMWVESHVNPGCWQYGHYEDLDWGYGLGQWTPARKLKNWAEALGIIWRGDGDNQLRFLDETPGQWNASYDPGAPSVTPPVTFEEFKTADLDVRTLSNYWMYYWEQPAYASSAETKQLRADKAEHYLELIGGVSPTPPKPKNKFNIYFWSRNIY